MNLRRVAISTVLGAAAGAICAYGSATSVPSLTLPILASIFYDRLLLGFVVGIADGIDVRPAMRGLVLGLVVSALIAIPSGLEGGAILMAAGAVYGLVIDILASRFS